MRRNITLCALVFAIALVFAHYTIAGQVPAAASDPDIPVSHQDRVYSAEQYSNTVSVTDPADNRLLGTIHLGDPLPANFSPEMPRVLLKWSAVVAIDVTKRLLVACQDYEYLFAQIER